MLNRTQYPSDVIALVVLWRLRYKLSLRDLAEMFLTRGFVLGERQVTPALAENLRRRRKGRVGRSWYVDEAYIRGRGRWRYLYRAIDRDGHLRGDASDISSPIHKKRYYIWRRWWRRASRQVAKADIVPAGDTRRWAAIHAACAEFVLVAMSGGAPGRGRIVGFISSWYGSGQLLAGCALR